MAESNLGSLQQEFEELSQKLTDPELVSNPQEYRRVAKRYGELKSILSQQGYFSGAVGERGLDSKDNEVILEIRAGAGGEEAALFAQELHRMYVRYAEQRGWKIKVLQSSRTELGGLKEIIFDIIGKEAFSRMRQERGVHRVQRIPETEKVGRVHTSTVSVAVLPKARPVDIEIKPEDIYIDTYRSSGPGGQNVNKTSSAVRITHLPTGIVASSQEGRLQQDNRELAMTILRSRLLQRKQEEQAQARTELRRQQIGSAERSEKIRTYNFPQDRVTDHRVGKSWGNIRRIMDGEINEIVEATR